MSEPLLKPGMTLALPSFRLSDYPVTDAPVTKRCYRHIVGEVVWKKIMKSLNRSSMGRNRNWKHFDYPVGCALEGDILHMVANQQKHRGFRIIRRNFKKWNLGDDYD